MTSPHPHTLLPEHTTASDASSESLSARTLAEFSSQVSNSFVPLHITSEHEPSLFTASLTTAHADDVAFTKVRANPHLVERTPETIEFGGAGYYKVSLLLSGSSMLTQDGKEIVMRPGDLSIYDTSRPYSLLFGEDFHNLIMMFPKDRLQLPIPFTEQLTAVRLSQEHPTLAPIVSAFLAQFPKRLHPCDMTLKSKLALTSLDLVGTLLSSILDTAPASRDPHQLLLNKIMNFIEANIGEPELSPGSIAAAHYISTRHLHSLFRHTNCTVSTWIRERRLERCRTDLTDPMLAEYSVSAIATRWGFTDAAHFSRVFKTAYGVSPREIRQHRIAA